MKGVILYENDDINKKSALDRIPTYNGFSIPYSHFDDSASDMLNRRREEVLDNAHPCEIADGNILSLNEIFESIARQGELNRKPFYIHVVIDKEKKVGGKRSQKRIFSAKVWL